MTTVYTDDRDVDFIMFKWSMLLRLKIDNKLIMMPYDNDSQIFPRFDVDLPF